MTQFIQSDLFLLTLTVGIFCGAQAIYRRTHTTLLHPVLMTFLLTLFLSLAKRRDDVLRMNETGEAPRENTIRYNLTFINQAITITASVTMVCYIMYTVSPEVVSRFGSDLLYLTTVFVVLGLLRYIQITVVDQKSGDPTRVMFRDRFIQLVVAAWALTFMFLIYVA